MMEWYIVLPILLFYFVLALWKKPISIPFLFILGAFALVSAVVLRSILPAISEETWAKIIISYYGFTIGLALCLGLLCCIPVKTKHTQDKCDRQTQSQEGAE
jgi:hypothetical protein